ncbi:sigma-54-dependent transcriptional regulator [Desulfitobacterium sp. Sab5]|uniref:sigma-54-dependent transcriptional regulator n=1 Tax=Desulfitobacterium nosdiversum TaxID=3375356 RepID=UPI003CEF5C5E
MSVRILVADDELSICSVLEERLNQASFEVVVANNGAEAIELCAQKLCQVAVVDLHMPCYNGLQCLQAIRQVNPSIVVIIITAFATIESAVEAMRMGADDYITKPFDLELLVEKLNRLLKLKRVLPESKIMSGQDSKLLGNSLAVASVHRMIEKLADLSCTVLITGESGTGKGLVARELHRKGKRAGRPFVYVDCSSLPGSLIESELFGYEKGTFTGAISARKGKLEAAEDGTIFLDEIGTMPIEHQVKLLNVLQERAIYHMGSTQPIKISARFVAATNENLEIAVSQGRFREDLYYRLNVVNIHIPPLRQRKEDIPMLADYFFARCAAENCRPPLTIGPGVIGALRTYDWPGNVRELGNMIESIVVLTDGSEIGLEDLPSKFTHNNCTPSVGGPSDASSLSLKEQELQMIISALIRNGGQREKTAQELGITRRTLLNKMKKLNLEF